MFLARGVAITRDRLRPRSDDYFSHRLPLARDVAYTSLGLQRRLLAGTAKSTAVRRLKPSPNRCGGLHGSRWWNKAAGAFVRGLVNRRTKELICSVGWLMGVAARGSCWPHCCLSASSPLARSALPAGQAPAAGLRSN